MERHVPRTCNLCEAMCGMIVSVDGDRIRDIRPDPEDVFSRGHICPKGPAMRELHEDPDRLRHPRRRAARGGFERVSWDEAFEEITSRVHSLQSEHGRAAVATYSGNPTAHNHGALLMGQVFGRVLGSRTRFDANSQDANPKLYASHLMYGEISALTVPDVDRTAFFLVFGANPIASGGSIMTLGDVRGRLRGIRERGGKIVLVDPRRTESADFADQHLAIRPGGDAALLLALLQVIFAEGLVDEVAVGQVARGLPALRAAVAPFSPESVAAAVGLEASAIRELALGFARAPSAVAYGRVGVCTNEFSALASYLIEALNVVTGNFDRPGGSMFTSPAIDLATLARRFGVGGAGRFRTRVRGLPEVGGMLPAAAMAEEMETAGKGQIRALVTLAGNPVLSVPNGERLARTLEKLELMVSIDIYVNETTRHAHFILPPRFGLERAHYDLIFHAIAVRNTAKWSEAVVPPAPDTLEDWDILYELAARLAAHRAGGVRLARATRLVRELMKPDPSRTIDRLLRLGRYGDKMNPFSKGLSLARLRAAPHGVDLGPLVPMRTERVSLPGGLAELGSPAVLADASRVARWIADRPADSLVLIGRRHLRSNNSWMHNVRSLVTGKDRATLMMHPDDAARRGLAGGADVRVKSRVGEVTAKLELTSDIRAGVVSLPHGFGHAAAKDTMRVAGAVPGPNVNAITDDAFVEPLTGTAILNGVPVVIERVTEPTAPAAE